MIKNFWKGLAIMMFVLAVLSIIALLTKECPQCSTDEETYSIGYSAALYNVAKEGMQCEKPILVGVDNFTVQLIDIRCLQ